MDGARPGEDPPPGEKRFSAIRRKNSSSHLERSSSRSALAISRATRRNMPRMSPSPGWRYWRLAMACACSSKKYPSLISIPPP